jgi:hypothetical protein
VGYNQVALGQYFFSQYATAHFIYHLWFDDISQLANFLDVLIDFLLEGFSQ